MIKGLKNMKISKRLMTSYIVVLILLVIGIVVSVVNLVNIGSQIENFYEHPYKVSDAAHNLGTSFESMKASVYRAMSNSDLGITNEAVKDAEKSVDGMTDLISTIEERFLGDMNIVKSLKGSLEKLIPMCTSVMDMASENRNEEAAAYMESDVTPAMNVAQSYIDQLTETSNNTGATLINTLQRTQTTAIVILLALCVASILVSLIFARFITNSITAPVEQIHECAASMSKGMLDASMITYSYNDELGGLAKNLRTTIEGIADVVKDISWMTQEMSHGNFNIESKNSSLYIGDFLPLIEAVNNMIANLSDTLSQINEASEQVSAGSGQMAESAQSLAEGATEQAGAVEELNATVEDVANASKSSAESTKKASGEVNHSVRKAETSREEMKNLIEAMEQIDTTSKEIANIIDAIEDIASQTNMLSLNASIEAARAGDAGRGFAVVANQIGKLAADSAQSASNTRNLITTILDKIKAGNEITNSTAESFEEIIKDIESFASVAENTSRMAEEQYDTMQQIRSGIEQISKVVQDNSASAEETSATSEELAAQAANLKSQVAKFKIKSR